MDDCFPELAFWQHTRSRSMTLTRWILALALLKVARRAIAGGKGPFASGQDVFHVKRCPGSTVHGRSLPLVGLGTAWTFGPKEPGES